MLRSSKIDEPLNRFFPAISSSAHRKFIFSKAFYHAVRLNSRQGTINDLGKVSCWAWSTSLGVTWTVTIFHWRRRPTLWRTSASSRIGDTIISSLPTSHRSWQSKLESWSKIFLSPPGDAVMRELRPADDYRRILFSRAVFASCTIADIRHCVYHEYLSLALSMESCSKSGFFSFSGHAGQSSGRFLMLRNLRRGQIRIGIQPVWLTLCGLFFFSPSPVL